MAMTVEGGSGVVDADSMKMSFVEQSLVAAVCLDCIDLRMVDNLYNHFLVCHEY